MLYFRENIIFYINNSNSNLTSINIGLFKKKNDRKIVNIFLSMISFHMFLALKRTSSTLVEMVHLRWFFWSRNKKIYF